MKRNLFLGLLALTAVIAVSWYFDRDWKLSRSSVQPSAANQPSVSVAEEKNPEKEVGEKVVVKNDSPASESKEALKAMAAEIISRPIMASAPLAEIDRKRAEGKIKEMIDLIKIDYDNIYPWYDLGAYRRVIGDFEGAAEAWAFGTLIRPKDYIGYQNLGDLYGFYVKDYPKSEENYFKSIQNNPQNIQAYLDLAIIYESVYKEKSDQIESILLRGLMANPDNLRLKSALENYYSKLE